MSNLHDELDRYLMIRRSFGYDLSTAARILRRFIAFADEKGTDHITTELFLTWKKEYGSAGNQTWGARLCIIRIFTQWLSGIDPRNEVPPKSLIPYRLRRSRPYIYSDQEIVKIIEETARIQSVYGIRGMTYSTLFGLIAVTGLRVSEALSLDNDDIDLASGVVTVRRGKLGKPRLIPISKSTTEALRAYVRERNRLLGAPTQPFFVSEKGTRPSDWSTRYHFARVCQRIGLRKVQKFYKYGRGPRIHDLRHTFAARTLIRWYRTGKNPEREMLKLTTYLGHDNLECTYWYIEAVPELLELASRRVARSLVKGGEQ